MSCRRHPNLPAATLALIGWIVAMGSPALGAQADLKVLAPDLRKAGTWASKLLGRSVPLRVYFRGSTTGEEPAPVIVYVMNHAAPRIGQEPDASILADYIGRRYVVLVLDYEEDARAVSPALDWDLQRLFARIYGAKTRSPLHGLALTPQEFRCFFLPAGYRVETDVPFWSYDKHGVFGTVERTIDTYNRLVVAKDGRFHVPGRETARRAEDLRDAAGELFDLSMRMDIVYPSQCKQRVPLAFRISTLTRRCFMVSPRVKRPHLVGFTMRGYAGAVIDHCYNPVAKHFRHFEPGYSLDDVNGVKAYSAAVRFLRAHADTYSLDGELIGGIGHSKGAYGITRLSDAAVSETSREHWAGIRGFPKGTPGPQPFAGFASNLAAGYQSMGNGTRRPQYVTDAYAPTLIACGKRDRFGHWKVWGKLKKAYADRDLNYLAMGMEDLGHDLPRGRDLATGADRYAIFHAFFDRYLKPEAKLPPVLLALSLTDPAHDAGPDRPVRIHFAPQMNEATVKDGVKVFLEGRAEALRGGWHVSRRGTHFTFTPKDPFVAGKRYRVVLSPDIRDRHGVRLAKGTTSVFTVPAKRRLPEGLPPEN